MAERLVGAKVRLVPLDFDRHFESVLRWANDPDVSEGLPLGDLPKTRPAVHEWFEARQRAGDGELSLAIEALGGEHVGHSALYRIDRATGSAGCGSLIDRAHWGRGYGKDAANVRAAFAFRTLGLRRLLSSHLEGNERSARMQRAVGFVEWGRLPDDVWQDGAYRAQVFTVLTRDRWESLQRPADEASKPVM